MKRRICPYCGFKWFSDTFYEADEVTPCPKCGREVPGDSIAKGG